MTQSEIAGVLAPDTELRIVAEGFTFTEGPIWHPGEDWLVFSDIAESIQYRWHPNKGLSVFRRPTNQANGNCFDLIFVHLNDLKFLYLKPGSHLYHRIRQP